MKGKPVIRAKTNTFYDNKGLGVPKMDSPPLPPEGNKVSYVEAYSRAFSKAYSKPVPWLVILFGNPHEWYRKRVLKYLKQ